MSTSANKYHQCRRSSQKKSTASSNFLAKFRLKIFHDSSRGFPNFLTCPIKTLLSKVFNTLSCGVSIQRSWWHKLRTLFWYQFHEFLNTSFIISIFVMLTVSSLCIAGAVNLSFSLTVISIWRLLTEIRSVHLNYAARRHIIHIHDCSLWAPTVALFQFAVDLSVVLL